MRCRPWSRLTWFQVSNYFLKFKRFQHLSKISSTPRVPSSSLNSLLTQSQESPLPCRVQLRLRHVLHRMASLASDPLGCLHANACGETKGHDMPQLFESQTVKRFFWNENLQKSAIKNVLTFVWGIHACRDSSLLGTLNAWLRGFHVWVLVFGVQIAELPPQSSCFCQALCEVAALPTCKEKRRAPKYDEIRTNH